jgi:hypothetical protein
MSGISIKPGSSVGVEPVVHEVDETTPLITERPQHVPDDEESSGGDGVGAGDESKPESPKSIMSIIAVLLIGVFLSQADTSLVLSSYGRIASEFDELDAGSWLLSSYMLAMCVAQPLVSLPRCFEAVVPSLTCFFLVWEAQRHLWPQEMSSSVIHTLCSWNSWIVSYHCTSVHPIGAILTNL